MDNAVLLLEIGAIWSFVILALMDTIGLHQYTLLIMLVLRICISIVRALLYLK